MKIKIIIAQLFKNRYSTPTYTNNNGIGNNPSDPTFEGTNSAKLYKLNSSDNKTGLGITLKVMAGDKLDIFGKSYYFQNNTGGSGANSAIPVLTLLNGFLGSPGSSGAIYNHGGISANDLNTSGGTAGISSMLSNQTTESNNAPTVPKAYINYILFDEQFKAVSYGYSKVGTNSTLKDHYSELQNIAVNKSGYVYIYCSNESPVNVFFDNLQVVHTRGQILEETHYYPFGLVMAGISNRSATQLENKIKYNGKEEQKKEFSDGSGLEWLDYGARMYDNQIGRWTASDPLSELYRKWSPYTYSINNPLSFTDPDGMGVESIHIDEKGKVLKNIDDGDNRVFVHANGTSSSDISNKYSSTDHSAGGKEIGELGKNIDMSSFFSNMLSANASIAKDLNIVEWANNVKTGGKWDLKNNESTIFGAAWQFDESSPGGKHTSFTNGNTTFSSAADVGNYHAGYTGTIAGISYDAQWVGAGVAEMLKNGQYGKMANPATYHSAPFGDNPIDYKWNTKGMTDAANKLGKPSPALILDARAQKAIKLLEHETRNQIGQF